jgi:phosphatidate cytidylyltransferase
MLRFRLISAAILLIGIFSLIFLDAWMPFRDIPGVYLIPGGLFFVFATSWEFSSLIHHLVPFRRLEIACLSCGVFLGGCAPILHQLFLARPYPPDCPVGVVGMVLVIAMVSMSWSSLRMLQDFTRRPETCLSTWAFASLVPLYVGGGASFWVLIRWFSVPTWGLWALVSVITVAKMSDTGAYFVGRALGRTKLCPAISPGKTIEGAVGGILVGMLVSMLLFAWILPTCFEHTIPVRSWLTTALFGAMLSVVGILGDLVESVVKRVSQSKDSGEMLPGLGGVWDVTDSLLPTAVAGYLGIVGELVWFP